MKKILATGLGAFIYLAANLNGQTNNSSNLEQKISEYKKEMNTCIENSSKTNVTAEEKAGFFLDAGFILEKYERFKNTLGSNDMNKVESDNQLAMKTVDLYIKRADRSICRSEFDKDRPSINVVETALEGYQQAYFILKKFEDQEEFIESARKIETGLAKAIIGLNNYAEFHKKDVFMNPDGKDWEFNPVVKIKELNEEVRAKRAYLEEISVCKKGVERSISSINGAAELNDGTAALDKMIIGVKWLTTMLGKDKSLFVKYFSEFNSASRPAMEIVKKKYDSDKMKEFERFYVPLTSHYKVLTQQASK